MKQTKLLLISVFALGGLLSATSCGEEVTPTLYNVETSAGAGTTITLSGDKTSFQPGEMVTFTVALTSTDGSQELKTVMFGDTSLAIESDGTYEVAMPSKDVTITTTAGAVEVTDYAVSLNAGDGSTITLTSGEGAARFAPGTEVTFTVAVDDERITTLDSVTVDGKEVNAVDGSYAFTMPNKDIEIATTTTVLGDGSLINISDVAFEVTSIEDVTNLLTQSGEKEAEYINGGHIIKDGVTNYEESYDYTYYVGNNNKLVYEGSRTTSNSATLSSYIYHEIGLYDATHYYEFNFDSSGGTNLTSSTVVSDDTEGYSSGTIKESEAKENVASAGFTATAADFMENITELERQEVSEDKKYLTIVMSGEDVGYAEYTKYDLTLVFDGDSLLRQADLKTTVYDSDDYDEEAGELVSGALSTKSGSTSIATERGYKTELVSKYNVRDYVVNDYTIITSSYFNNESTEFVGGGEVNNGANLSFRFRSNELKPMRLAPRPIEIRSDVEDIATVSGSSISVQKEGEFTVVFDNGLGDLKEVTYTSVRPAPSRISAYLSASSVFVGNSVTLTAEITPEQALQDYTVTLKEDSACTVDIAKNEDGSYTITGKTEGEGTLVVASIENPTIFTEVAFSVVTPPTYDVLYKFITENTLTGDVIYSYYTDLTVYINFNTDGTGEYRIDDNYYNETGEVVTFTYTLNQDTLEFNLETTGDVTDSSSYTIYSIRALSNSSLEVVVDRFGSPEDPAILTSMGSKVDLSAL